MNTDLRWYVRALCRFESVLIRVYPRK